MTGHPEIDHPEIPMKMTEDQYARACGPPTAFVQEYARIKWHMHKMYAKSLEWLYKSPYHLALPYPVEEQLVNMMSGFRTKYMMFRHTPYSDKEREHVERALYPEWFTLVARLGEWPPPFTRELWDRT